MNLTPNDYRFLTGIFVVSFVVSLTLAAIFGG